MPTSPRTTNLMLLATLVFTGAAVFDVARRDTLGARVAAAYLALFTLLFLIRVAGQLLVIVQGPTWLPPATGGNWNLVPYRFLLPAQLAILILMAAIISAVSRAHGMLGTPQPRLGAVLVSASGVYAGIMAVRYVVRMARRPGERWFGGAIPIVFHMVLAAFLFTWGRFHVQR